MTCCYKEPDTEWSVQHRSYLSCDGHCIVEYRESRSPADLGISRYDNPSNNANLLDRDIGDMDLTNIMFSHELGQYLMITKHWHA